MKNKNQNYQIKANASARGKVSEQELEERYANTIDSKYPPFRCCGIEYAASATLSLVDETAYDQGFEQYLASGWKEHPSRPGFYIPKSN